MSVLVLDRQGVPLMPCSQKRARLLLSRGRARVHRLVPFVIRLVDVKAEHCQLQPLSLKIDPGSKTTGMALVRAVRKINSETGEVSKGAVVLSLVEIAHRGRKISEALTARRQMRRRRRGNLRYRAPRFLNRGNKGKGRIAPSLQHRVDAILAWVKRLMRWAPIHAVAQELVRFDMQAMQTPGIEGVQYQQGTLAGYEIREFLLVKWGRKCAYCGAENVPLQIEHIQPKARGGGNRESNLTLACQCCNEKKAALPIDLFLAKKPEVLKRILVQAKRPLKDAAAVNTTRWALFNALKTTCLPVETSSGGRTKFNRQRNHIPKTHALDAVCVGEVDWVENWNMPTLHIKCTGRGSYQRTRLDKFGFTRGYLMREKSVHGFVTGDLVKATVTKGKKQGCYRGRVAIRATGSFNIQTAEGVVQGISHKHCTLLQRGDGYGYQQSSATQTREEVVLRTTRSASPA
ncbi:RNA-guided endonuclease IscB [Rhodoferax sp.]|uniref:RNA-guided endonuclease IscB n=1 Tax=Rhodoferax sp. TaxID=50421 RepID=UPI002ABBB960|nr:RNA-guided endonuclease IscB [Rhodoferax sp.]MDZ4207497.1 RNA-guided endonuclease IscB [Rhodoferax sp.]